MPTKPLPGTGASIRIDGAASASARSSARAAILLTLTLTRLPPRTSTKSGSTPNCVMVGPRLISTTCAGAPKAISVSSISLARSRSKSSSALPSTPGSRISAISGRTQSGAGGSGTASGRRRDLGAVRRRAGLVAAARPPTPTGRPAA